MSVNIHTILLRVSRQIECFVLQYTLPYTVQTVQCESIHGKLKNECNINLCIVILGLFQNNLLPFPSFHSFFSFAASILSYHRSSLTPFYISSYTVTIHTTLQRRRKKLNLTSELISPLRIHFTRRPLLALVFHAQLDSDNFMQR